MKIIPREQFNKEKNFWLQLESNQSQLQHLNEIVQRQEPSVFHFKYLDSFSFSFFLPACCPLLYESTIALTLFSYKAWVRLLSAPVSVPELSGMIYTQKRLISRFSPERGELLCAQMKSEQCRQISLEEILKSSLVSQKRHQSPFIVFSLSLLLCNLKKTRYMSGVYFLSRLYFQTKNQKRYICLRSGN